MIDAERVKALRLREHLVEHHILTREQDDALLAVLDDRSTLKAENEKLGKAVLELGIQAAENLSRAEKVEAALERQRPLIEAVNLASIYEDENGKHFVEIVGPAILRAALAYKEKK